MRLLYRTPSRHQKRTAQEALEAATRKLGLHSVRFDLGGRLIDPAGADMIDMRQGLHHHGDAPAAPGYTLAELSHLARSTVPAQRSQALLTLAGVLGHRPAREVGNADGPKPARLPQEDVQGILHLKGRMIG